jgi:hypothetical protein
MLSMRDAFTKTSARSRTSPIRSRGTASAELDLAEAELAHRARESPLPSGLSLPAAGRAVRHVLLDLGERTHDEIDGVD